MATKQKSGISSEAARKATGKRWEEWFALLNQAGAKQWSHKEIVAYLKAHHSLSSWWQQMVTNSYEKAQKGRVVGQTTETGFQLGVQKTLPIPRSNAWKLLTSTTGMRIWLGRVQGMQWEEGFAFTTHQGVMGKLRIVKPEQRLRMAWQLPNMPKPATLQVTLTTSAPGKTVIGFHLEQLTSAAWRVRLKKYWNAIVADLESKMVKAV